MEIEDIEESLMRNCCNCDGKGTTPLHGDYPCYICGGTGLEVWADVDISSDAWVEACIESEALHKANTPFPYKLKTCLP